MDKDIVGRAEAFARAAHFGVVNKYNGEPYINHPERVVAHLPEVCRRLGVEITDEMIATAWLHDTLEDVDWVTPTVLLCAFGGRVAGDVMYLSRNHLDGSNYYGRILAQPRIRPVKVADLWDNTDPDRLASLAEKDRDRLVAKYDRAYEALQVPHDTRR